MVGEVVGNPVGFLVGADVGNLVGRFVGLLLGKDVGSFVGNFEGEFVGNDVGGKVGGSEGGLGAQIPSLVQVNPLGQPKLIGSSVGSSQTTISGVAGKHSQIR